MRRPHVHDRTSLSRSRRVRMLATLAASASSFPLALPSRMPRPPRAGTYAVPSFPDLRVAVFSERMACVAWGEGCATVEYDPEHGTFDLDEPLAGYARRAGAVLTRVDYDSDRDAMRVDFDGRVAFTVELRRVSPLFLP